MGLRTQTDSAEAPFPHSTSETAEFLGEDLQQVRAWAGWAGLGWEAGPCRLSVKRLAGRASRQGPGCVIPCWPGEAQEGRAK